MGRNRTIDGLRGISILLVLCGHLIGYRFYHLLRIMPVSELVAGPSFDIGRILENLAFRLLQPMPVLGVEIFFVISGYLITALLAREEAQRGSVNLAAFYVRRVGRIVPPFAVYILALALLRQSGAIVIQPDAFWWSAAYLCDVSVSRCGWWLGHSWTLAVEEQFYLAWPLVFIALGVRRRPLGLALVVASSIALSFAYPVLINFGYIALGALLASSASTRSIFRRLATPRLVTVALLILLVHPFTASSVLYPVIGAISPFPVALLFFAALEGTGPLAAVAAWGWVQRLGVVSYSVYLWQQVSTGPVGSYSAAPLLLFPGLFVVPALLSYRWVERPSIRVAHALSQRLLSRMRPVQPIAPTVV